MPNGESIPAVADAEGKRPPVESERGVSNAAPAEGVPERPAAARVGEGRQAAHEESTVIDVHAPHGGLHTWRDFWIHLGTIALGLLIAIGLEQSVEWMHHLHQRHQLEHDLSEEIKVNHDAVLGDLRRQDVVRGWVVALRDEVKRMRDSGGRLKLAYIPEPMVDPQTGRRLYVRIVPSDAAWKTATESDMVALLPRSEAEVYSRLELQHEFLLDTFKQYLEMENEVKRFEANFESTGSASDTPDLNSMSTAQLDEYATILSRQIAATNYLDWRLRLYDTEAEAILHGAHSEGEILQQVIKTPPQHD